ncbi:MAG: sec-independent translocase [Streptosporangiaceae bacterium]
MFDLSFLKILVLGVIALVIFGPDQLPRIAGQAGRLLRDLRTMADRARSELQENLGPEFEDFDLADLNPRAFVRKHLWEDEVAEPVSPLAAASPPGGALPAGEMPPYDSEAT